MIGFLVAVGIGVAIFVASLWVIRLLATPPPGEPDPDEAVPVDVPYACSVCGLQLTVSMTHGEEFLAPKHCREEMIEV